MNGVLPSSTITQHYDEWFRLPSHVITDVSLINIINRIIQVKASQIESGHETVSAFHYNLSRGHGSRKYNSSTEAIPDSRILKNNNNYKGTNSEWLQIDTRMACLSLPRILNAQGFLFVNQIDYRPIYVCR